LPQVVIAMAVTREGVPVRCWTFAGNEPNTTIIRTIKDDLAGWNLHRMVWVAVRGFASQTNRAYLTKGGGHYIHAEKLRHTNTEARAALARAGRYRTVAGNLRLKEVHVNPNDPATGGDSGMRAQRFVICHNPEQAERDATVRANLITHLRTDRRLRRLDRPQAGRARRVAEGQARPTPLPAPHQGRPAAHRPERDQVRGAPGRQVAAAHLRPHPVTRRPRGGVQAAHSRRVRVARHEGPPRPAFGVPPHREDRIRAHVQLCWLALLLIRVV
jgi:hypothetical protein